MPEDLFESYMRKIFSMHQADQQTIAQQKARIDQLETEAAQLRHKLRHHAQSMLDEAQTGAVPAVSLSRAFDQSLLENPFPDGFLRDQPVRPSGVENSFVVGKD